MAIKGSLKEAGLPDVCQLLAIGHKSGCLSVTDQARFGEVYFDRGRITHARIVNRRDRLGDYLVHEGALTREELAAAVAEQAGQPDRRLGELLLERGAVDPHTLTACVRRQVEEAVYFLFTWRRGSFHFEPGRTPQRVDVLLDLSPETLLLEGARRVDEWAVIQKKISSLDLIFDLDRPRLETSDVRLSRDQERVVPLLNGGRSVREVAERSGLDEFAVGRALYGLVQAGFATRVGRREEALAESVDPEAILALAVAFYRTGMLTEAEREFRRVLQNDSEDARARHYLALIALRQGNPVRAMNRLTALLEMVGPRPGVYLNLAHAYRLQHRYAEALAVLGDARQLAPGDERMMLAEAMTLLAAGEAGSAARRMAEYRLAVPPDRTPPALYYYGAALAGALLGRWKAVTGALEEGLRRHPRSAPLRLLTGHLAAVRGEPEAAAAAYRWATEEDPGLAHAHRGLGDVAFERGAGEDAIEHYRRAAELAPGLDDDLFIRMAQLHYQRDEREEAVRCWRRAIEINPTNQVARAHLDGVSHARP
jgi:tetratricopeptide (TPR) repeat protein